MNNTCGICYKTLETCDCQQNFGVSQQGRTTGDITCPHCNTRITYRDLHKIIPSGNSPIITGQ